MNYFGKRRMKMMKNRKEKKTNLDERQEQILLKIEHNGCWLAFWLLFMSLVIETIAYFDNPKVYMGEWLIFMVLAIYIFAGCMKNNIWDRKLKPNASTNLVVSLIAGGVVAVFNSIAMIIRTPDFVGIAIGLSAFVGVLTFAVCFIILQVSASVQKKKQMKLDAEPEE